MLPAITRNPRILSYGYEQGQIDASLDKEPVLDVNVCNQTGSNV
jgi:hypothetical protein